jgi:hypothetical protein
MEAKAFGFDEVIDGSCETLIDPLGGEVFSEALATLAPRRQPYHARLFSRPQTDRRCHRSDLEEGSDQKLHAVRSAARGLGGKHGRPSSYPSGIRQRSCFRTASHSLQVPSSETPEGPVNITREPAGNSGPPPSSTRPAPSFPQNQWRLCSGMLARRDSVVEWRHPAAVILQVTSHPKPPVFEGQSASNLHCL